MQVIKLSLLLLLHAIITLSLSAQTETFLGDGLQSVSGFGGPTFAVSQIGGQNTFWAGGQGGVVFNERLILGGGGYQMINEANILNREVEMGMGGILIGYIFKPQRKLHFTATLLAGGGTISGTGDNFANFRSVTPNLEIEANVTHYFKIGLGVGQHFIAGLADPLYPTDAELSRPILGLSFRFGAF